MQMYRFITAFDVLAELCSYLSKEEERKSAIRWETASEEDISICIEKYRNLIAIILNSSAREYILSIEESEILEKEFLKLDKLEDKEIHEIYLLAMEVENKIDVYSNWQGKGMIYSLGPLNKNYATTGIAIYPYFAPLWDIRKSERIRDRTLNARFQNYIMVRKAEESPFEIIMHYWNDTGLLKKTDSGWMMSIALTPVSDDAHLDTVEIDNGSGKQIRVDGLKNKDQVEERIINIFEEIFEKKYSIIMFPEALGSEEILCRIKEKMRQHPEYMTLVVLPTCCSGGHNTRTHFERNGECCIPHLRRTAGSIILSNPSKYSSCGYDTLPIFFTGYRSIPENFGKRSGKHDDGSMDQYLFGQRGIIKWKSIGCSWYSTASRCRGGRRTFA